MKHGSSKVDNIESQFCSQGTCDSTHTIRETFCLILTKHGNSWGVYPLLYPDSHD